MNACGTCFYWKPVGAYVNTEIKVGECMYRTSDLNPFDVRELFGSAPRVVVGDEKSQIMTAEGFGCGKHREAV